jgi:RNA polymerase sigma-70 factor (ECF subfamily)
MLAASGGQGEHGARVTFCVVPRDLAGVLHELLRRHFSDDASVTVVVERREAERRSPAERRREQAAALARERRRTATPGGRRVAEQRTARVSEAVAALPRAARRHAARLTFFERVEPAGVDLEDLDTARVVARIRAGNSEAFSVLYTRYFDRVYNYLVVVLRSPHEAEDVTQQVFMRVLEALGSYEQRGPFRGWLFAIVRNHAVSHLRKHGRLESVDPSVLDERRASSPMAGDLSALDWISDRELLMFIERLPLAQRQVLMLRYMLDLRHGEIARILGRSPEDVRMLQSRAQRFLRQRLGALRQEGSRRDRSHMLRRQRQAYVLRRRRFSLMT